MARWNTRPDYRKPRRTQQSAPARKARTQANGCASPPPPLICPPTAGLIAPLARRNLFLAPAHDWGTIAAIVQPDVPTLCAAKVVPRTWNHRQGSCGNQLAHRLAAYLAIKAGRTRPKTAAVRYTPLHPPPSAHTVPAFLASHVAQLIRVPHGYSIRCKLSPFFITNDAPTVLLTARC